MSAKHRLHQVNDVVSVQIDPPFPVDLHIHVTEVTPTLFKGKNARDVWDPIQYQFPRTMGTLVQEGFSA